MPITLDQMKAPVLREAEVYLDRFGGTVRLRELTGDQVLFAAQWSLEAVGGTDGFRTRNVAKQRRLNIALALVEPQLADKDEAKAAAAETVLKDWPSLELLLLNEVIGLLDEGLLTQEQRERLAVEEAAHLKLDALGVNTTPEGIIAASEDNAETAMLLKVALRVPEVLFGRVSMTVVRMLSEAIDAEQAQFAALLAGAGDG